MLAFRPVLSSVFALSSLISFSQSLNDKGKHQIKMDTTPSAQQQPISASDERRTLRLVKQSDIDNIHQYLGTYINDPSAALNVEELVIDVQAWPSYPSFLRSHQSQEPPSPPTADQIALHDRLKAHAQTIGLPEETTTQLIESLDWKFTNAPTPAENTSHEDAYRSQHKTTRGYAAACAILLFSLCRNITHLQLYGAEYSHPPVLRDFLLFNNYGKLPSQYLEKLQSVLVQSEKPSDEREYDGAEFLEHFRFFGRLPSIKNYHANACMAYQAERDTTPPGSVNFKSIKITNTDIEGGIISSIIRAPRELEEFVLSTGGLAHFEGGTSVACVKTLGKSLLEHKDTLKVLDLDIAHVLTVSREEEQEDGPDPDDEDEDEEMDDDNDDDDDDDDNDGNNDEDSGGGNPNFNRKVDEYFRLDQAHGNGKPIWARHLPDTRPYGRTIGSLHDFTKLESLSIQIAALLGPSRETLEMYRMTPADGETITPPPFRLIDGLPSSLKTLRLYDYHRGADAFWDENVDELKAKMAEKFPLLTELVGIDEPLVVNSQYDEGSGYDEDNPPPEVARRMERFFSKT